MKRRALKPTAAAFMDDEEIAGRLLGGPPSNSGYVPAWQQTEPAAAWECPCGAVEPPSGGCARCGLVSCVSPKTSRRAARGWPVAE